MRKGIAKGLDITPVSGIGDAAVELHAGGAGSGLTFDARDLFVVKGTANTANTNAIVNAGTIQVNPQGAGQVTGLNYGQTLGFTNLSTGTIVKSGLGSGTFVGNFGSQNRVFASPAAPAKDGAPVSRPFGQKLIGSLRRKMKLAPGASAQSRVINCGITVAEI